jgi:hypothetical protein
MLARVLLLPVHARSREKRRPTLATIGLLGKAGRLQEKGAFTTVALMKSTCCRFCGDELQDTLVDLGMSPPLHERYLPESELDKVEPFYPLHAWVCPECLLGPLEQDLRGHEIFSEYAPEGAHFEPGAVS